MDIKINENDKDALAQLVMERFNRAKMARNQIFYQGKSINQWLNEAWERYSGNQKNQEFNLTLIKMRQLHAKIKDMIIHSADAPFTIAPTPQPQLPEELMNEIFKQIEGQLGEKLIEAGLTLTDETGAVFPNYQAVLSANQLTVEPSIKEWLKNQSKQLKQSYQAEADKIAEDRANKMTEMMYDQMLEGGWRNHFLDCLFDVFLFGTGVLRCELRQHKNLHWKKNKLVEKKTEQLQWRHIPIKNCFPSPDSENAQVGTYFIERSAMRKQDLLNLLQVDWIDQERVKKAYQNGHRYFNWLNDMEFKHFSQWSDDDLIDVLIHEGSVQGNLLKRFFGHKNNKKIDEFKYYQTEILVIAGVAVGARIQEENTSQLKSSYFSGVFQKAGRGFWGFGCAMVLANAEDRLNQLLADLKSNLENGINPPIFYNANRFDSHEDIQLGRNQNLNKLIPFNPDTMGQDHSPPFYQVQFPSKSAEIMNLFNWFYRLADDESGLPSSLMGNSAMGGESTFRGMKLLATNSAMIIKDAFLNLDQTLIQPAMEHLWRWNMLNHPNNEIKADAKVVARGATGLMQQEIANAERADVMPMIIQLLQQSGLPPQYLQDTVQYLLRETMKQGGLPVNQLLPDNLAMNEQNEIIQSLQPASPEPTIGTDQNLGGLV